MPLINPTLGLIRQRLNKFFVPPDSKAMPVLPYVLMLLLGSRQDNLRACQARGPPANLPRSRQDNRRQRRRTSRPRCPPRSRQDNPRACQARGPPANLPRSRQGSRPRCPPRSRQDNRRQRHRTSRPRCPPRSRQVNPRQHPRVALAEYPRPSLQLCHRQHRQGSHRAFQRLCLQVSRLCPLLANRRANHQGSPVDSPPRLRFRRSLLEGPQVSHLEFPQASLRLPQRERRLGSRQPSQHQSLRVSPLVNPQARRRFYLRHYPQDSPLRYHQVSPHRHRQEHLQDNPQVYQVGLRRDSQLVHPLCSHRVNHLERQPRSRHRNRPRCPRRTLRLMSPQVNPQRSHQHRLAHNRQVSPQQCPARNLRVGPLDDRQASRQRARHRSQLSNLLDNRQASRQRTRHRNQLSNLLDDRQVSRLRNPQHNRQGSQRRSRILQLQPVSQARGLVVNRLRYHLSLLVDSQAPLRPHLRLFNLPVSRQASRQVDPQVSLRQSPLLNRPANPRYRHQCQPRGHHFLRVYDISVCMRQ